MANQGWIKLHRSLLDHWLFQYDPLNGFGAWVDLLLMANHKDGKVYMNGVLYEVKKGSFITSILKLSERWNKGRKWVSCLLTRLEKDRMILQKRDNRFTLITISNYSDFQSTLEREGTSEGQLRDNWGTSEGHKQECKEGKNEKNKTKTLYRTADAVQRIFVYWQQIMNKPKSKLDGKRKRKIKDRLKDGYSEEDLKNAIVGCSNSDFHMGVNEKNMAYNDLELICRDGGKVDRFIEFEKNPPRTGKGASLQQSVVIADSAAKMLEGVFDREN